MKKILKKPEEDKIEGMIFTDRVVDTNDINDSVDFEYDSDGKYTMPENVKYCVYCGAEWTPKMEELLVSSGYCETCYSEDSFGVIVCSKCNRIVYRK